MRITVKPELIQARSSLWVAWARIALEHETIAQAARQQALALGAAHRQALQQGDADEK
jgi:hypothetical protein